MKAFLFLALLALASCGPTDKPVEQSTTETAAAPAASAAAPDPHQERVTALHRYYRETDSTQTVRVGQFRERRYRGLANEEKTVAAELAKAKASLDQLDQMIASKSTDEAAYSRLLDVGGNALGQAKVAGLMANTESLQQQMAQPK